jgi:hypothetical protein
MMPKKPKSSPNSYDVGYRRPPKKFQFKQGRSGNPTGKRKKPSNTPDLKAQLESELNKAVTIRSGRRLKTLTKAAAGIKQLVDQFAKGDRNARRDLLFLSEKLGVALTNRDALEGVLQNVLGAEDEELLADFVKRHGGQYPLRADMVRSPPNQGSNLLSPPEQEARLLTAPPGNSTDRSRRAHHE